MRALIGVTCPTEPDIDGKMNYNYCRLVQEAGAVPLVCSLPTEPEQVKPILDALDALVITHEACHPCADDELAERFLLAALEEDMPVLAVDSGCLLLNRVMGGSCSERSAGQYNHEQGSLPGHMAWHTLRLDPWSCLATFVGETRVEANSFHRLCITSTGAGLIPVGWSEDGTVEAVESKVHTFVVGVQFRPQLMPECGQRLFRAFRRSAESHRQHKRRHAQKMAQVTV